jgi:hypothetical protein
MRARVFVLLGLAGCTSSSLTPGGSTPSDMSSTALADLSQPIASPSPLLSGSYYLNGITSDGQLVVTGSNATDVSLLPEAGGTPTKIGTANVAEVRGDTVLLFTNVDVSAGIYSLSAYSGGSSHPLAAATTLYFTPQLSADGQYALYFDKLSDDGSTGDLVTSKLDGSDRFTLVSQTVSGNSVTTGCYPYGDILGGGFVISYCDNVDADAGTSLGNIATVDPKSGALTQVVSNSNYSSFVVNPTHQRAFTDDDLYNGLLFAADGKPREFAPSVLNALFDSDGSVIYTTFTDLDRYNQVAHLSTLLQPTPTNSSYLQLIELSPDGKTALVTLNVSTSATAYGQDLWTVDLSPNAPFSPILKQPTGLPVEYFAGGSSFTLDSKYVFFESPLDQTTYLGPLRVAPISGGDGSGTMVAGSTLQLLPTHDSFALVCANPDAYNNCDLLLVDAAHPSSVQTLDTLVQGYSLYLSKDGKTLFYSVSDGQRSGIYSRPVP